MKQQAFERTHEQEWRDFERVLQHLERNRRRAAEPVDTRGFPASYRRMCHHLSLAKERHYSARLVETLNDLVLRGHQQLYRRKPHLARMVREYLVAGFPALVRQQWGCCLAALALFYGSAAALWLLTLQFPELIHAVLDAGAVRQVEEMYRPDALHIGWVRDADSDFMMFGFYIQHNIGIGFRTFAGGVAYGIGSIGFLVYNGIVLGALSGHIMNIDYGARFFSFVAGHSSFELTAIVLSGAAGIRLGLALVSPGRLPRMQALRQAAGVAIRIMYGVMLMLVLAAFIEAFWSSSTAVASGIKYAVGAVLWLFIILYFTLMGRARGA